MKKARKWGLLISVIVTGLSVLTMSGLAFGVLLGSFTDKPALTCDQVPGTPQPFEGKRHIPYDGAPHDPYRSMPPTSGPHSPRVVPPGIYRKPVAEELQVHVLEHGHVLLQYAPDVPADVVDDLERIGRQYPRDVVVAPYPKLGHGIALSGWQRSQRLDSLDEAAIVGFVTTVPGRYNHQWRNGATDCLPPHPPDGEN
jgi:hypothetical protein